MKSSPESYALRESASPTVSLSISSPASDFTFKHHVLSYERKHTDLYCLAI